MAYIITCSGTKNDPQNIVSNINKLSYPELVEARNELLKIVRFNLNWIDPNWNNTAPAWYLYSGKGGVIYPRIEEQNWVKPNVNVKIVSALFGLIKHTDNIPKYDLVMTDKLPNSKWHVYDFWRSKNLLQNFICQNDIDLLSKNYRKAFNPNGLAISNTPNIVWADNYGFHKGRYLNEQLNNL